MENLNKKVDKKEYRNWVKSTLGLQQTKKALHAYVIEKFSMYINGTSQLKTHQKFLSEEELKHIKHVGYFRTKLKRSVQFKSAPKSNTKIWVWRLTAICSSENSPTENFCCKSFEKIVALHRKFVPNIGLTVENMYWENSDNTLNMSLEWAIAKMFMPQGNIDNNKPDDTDPYALFHLMSVCDLFTNAIRHNHLKELKRARNALFHSSDNEVQDEDVTKYFDHMEGLLTDALNDNDVADDHLNKLKLKEDITNLMKLKTCTLTVSMIDEALRIKREQIYNHFNTILNKDEREQLMELVKLSEKTAEDIKEVNTHSEYVHELETYKSKVKKLKRSLKINLQRYNKKNKIHKGKEHNLKKQVKKYKMQINTYKQHAFRSKEHADRCREELVWYKRQWEDIEVELFFILLVLAGAFVLIFRFLSLVDRRV